MRRTFYRFMTMILRSFKPGDPVIYSLPKTSTHPGPRACAVMPAPHGDTYNYYVNKFWRVKEIYKNGQLLLVTRRGKERMCRQNDPNLKKAGLFERLRYRDRFPDPDLLDNN